MTTKCCKTCELWDYVQAMDAGGRIRRDRTALCKWKSLESLPESVVDKGFYRPGEIQRILTPSIMTSSMGKDCQCWQERVKP